MYDVPLKTNFKALIQISHKIICRSHSISYAGTPFPCVPAPLQHWNYPYKAVLTRVTNTPIVSTDFRGSHYLWRHRWSRILSRTTSTKTPSFIGITLLRTYANTGRSKKVVTVWCMPLTWNIHLFFKAISIHILTKRTFIDNRRFM